MKKLKKVVGIGVCGYAIVNTLVWAYVGTGRYLKDVCASNNSSFDELNYSFESADEGWKTWLHRTFSRG